ncbi:MAG TPA: hypothetical protein VFU22_14860, partial [Roseiflexaceae bacterium]|nr:hypothetical protein [Roseiflexaceae bacterium]
MTTKQELKSTNLRTFKRSNLLTFVNEQFLKRDGGQLLIVAVFLLLLPLSFPRIYATDEVQYYAYLRSVYFDHDLDFRNEYEHFAAIGEQQRPPDPAVRNALLHIDAQNPNPITGKLRNVAPIGSAIMWAPGFVLADLGVRAANAFGAGIAADGYSRPYIWAACFMSALYGLGGLLLSYRLARRFAGAFAATLATIAIWLATPLVMYTFILMPWSHTSGFFLFALFLAVWLGPEARPRTKDQRLRTKDDAGNADRDRAVLNPPPWSFVVGLSSRGLGRWALLGLIGGLMTITREQLGLLLIIPAAEAVIAYTGFARARRWDAARRLLTGHVLFAAFFATMLAPQLVTYQILNGRPLPSSTVGSKLIWCSPHFIDTLIDYDPRPSAWCYFDDPIAAKLKPFAHGAFLWSPILVPALLGLGLLARGRSVGAAGRRAQGAPVLAALLLLGFLAQTYINGAFGTTWHLTRSFGFRRLIECTPIFVLGLAPLLASLRQRLGRWPLLLIAAFLI